MSDPLDDFAEFSAKVRARLEQGRVPYGDRSFHRPEGELMDEMEQEILDWMGWGYVLWKRHKDGRDRVG